MGGGCWFLAFHASLLTSGHSLGSFGSSQLITTAPQLLPSSFFFFFFFGLFAISRATPVAYGGSQARGLFGTVAAGLHQSHSNVGSEPCLGHTPQLTATPDR